MYVLDTLDLDLISETLQKRPFRTMQTFFRDCIKVSLLGLNEFKRIK